MNRDVVISGVGGLYPDCWNVDELKTRLLANENLVHLKESLWSKHNSYGIEPTAGVMPQPHSYFDHTFFGMHTKLATWADPVCRLGCERAFEAIVDAGISPTTLKKSFTSVYAGVSLSESENIIFTMLTYAGEGYSVMGLSRAMNANRISYFFDLNGHSCTFDSSWGWSQQGLQLAHSAIRSGECDAALVLSSNLTILPDLNFHLKNLGRLSSDGLTRSFDANGAGSQRSDGVVCMFLQRADLAKRCYGHLVFSRCRTTEGTLSFDPTVHNPAGIERFLRDAYRENGQDPRRVVYLEADGSANKVLEEIELQAAAAVLCAGRDSESPLLIGSVKSNVGHTEASNGLVAVSKLIVAMETGTIPATINHGTPNPNIKGLVDGRLKVVTENVPLKIDEDTLVAATSMGLVGSVGHVVLKPNLKSKTLSDPPRELPRLVPIAGRTKEAVEKGIKFVRSVPFDPEYYRLVQDVFASEIRGYEFRSYTICPEPQEAPFTVEHIQPQALWFVYSGMGSQWAGMGRDLMQLPLIKETIERLHAILEKKGVDLITIITEEGDAAFNNILKSFVGITAMQIALTNVLTALGVKPDKLIGHSVGELGCSYADGCLTEEQTILAAYARGKASNDAELVPGMMAAVGLGYKDILPRLPAGVEVACHNSSTSCTLSGSTDLVNTFVKQLTDEGVFARAVNVSNIAYHSQYIQPAAPLLRKYLEEVIPDPKPRSSKWISTSVPQSQWDTPAARLCSAEYHTNNLLGSVLFEEGMTHIPEQAILVEIAPHGLLQAILKRALPNNIHVPLTQRGAESNLNVLLSSIGRLFSKGLRVQVSALYPEISFPVSRGTPSLAPLLSWNHENSVSFMDVLLGRKATAYEGIVSSSGPTLTANGRNLYPLSELFMHVWKGLAEQSNCSVTDFPVIFRNIHVVSWIERPPGGHLALAVTYLPGSGHFEVEVAEDEKRGRLVMWGFITPQDDKSRRNPLPPRMPDEVAFSMEPQDALDELDSKGLSYSFHYRSISALHQSSSDWTATVRNDGTWSRLIEPVIQLTMLQQMRQGTEALSLPRTIQRFDVDPRKINGKTEVSMRLHMATGLVEGDGLYMEGVTMEKYVQEDMAPLRKQFVPHGPTDLQSEEEFVAVAAQVALEMAPRRAPALTVIEVQDSTSSLNGLGPTLRTALKNVGSVQADVRSMDASALSQLADKNAFLLISGPSTIPETTGYLSRSGGLLLTRTAVRIIPAADLAVVAEQKLGHEWLTLLKKAEPVPAGAQVMELEADEDIPAKVAASSNNSTVIIWRGEPKEGVLAVTRAIRKSKIGTSTRLVFVLDRNAPRLSLSTPELRSQLRLGLPVNILRGGIWGSWRVLPIGKCAPTVLALQCVEQVQIQVLGLNVVDQSSSQRKKIQPGPLDFVGVDLAGKGRRVMGVARCVSTHSRLRLDPELRWTVPDTWSNQEAATVPYTYSAAFFGLQIMERTRKGESVLVHQGASPLGQAALRVACHLGCAPIYTTVSSDAERNILLSNFPMLQPSNVLSCADLSFEWQLRILTKGRGVKVIVSDLTGPQMLASLRCIAVNGRFLHFGREDMLSAKTFGMFMFVKSAAVLGFFGDQLFHASKRDRAALVQAVREGLDKGIVQPIVGSMMFPAIDLQEALTSLEMADCTKVALDVKFSGGLGARQCNPSSSYVIMGGSSARWHQVAGWLCLNGARTIVAATAVRPGLLATQQLHAQALHRAFGANVIVQEVPTWDAASATRVVENASKITPIDAVIVLLEDASWSRVPILVNEALSRHRDASLLVLSSDPVIDPALCSMCEDRRRAGLRTACVSGAIHDATNILARVLGEDPPAVTMLPSMLSVNDADSMSVAGLKEQIPCTTSDLAALGAAVQKLPTSSYRLREIGTMGRQSRYALEATPIFVFPPLGVLLPATRATLSILGRKIMHPLICLEGSPTGDITQQATIAVKALRAARPIGPYSLLGWALSSPLTQEVARQLESTGTQVCTYLVDGNLAAMGNWARRQLDEGLEPLDADGVGQRLQSPEAQQGLSCIRGFIEAVAKHKPLTNTAIRGKLVLVGIKSTVDIGVYPIDSEIIVHACPGVERHRGLASPWLAGVVNSEAAVPKMVTENELRKMLFSP